MTKRLAFATFLLCTLAGCGNKGPLVMPDPPQAPPAADAAPAPAPGDDATPAPADAGTPGR